MSESRDIIIRSVELRVKYPIMGTLKILSCSSKLNLGKLTQCFPKYFSTLLSLENHRNKNEMLKFIPKICVNTRSPVVPIISNGVLIWAPIIAHYCTLLHIIAHY